MPATALSPFYYVHTSDIVGAAATIIVETGVENASYPAANLVNLSFAKIAAPAKVTGTTGYWQGDFGAAQRVDFVVFWHNGDEDVQLVYEAHSSASWGSPTVSGSVVCPAKRADGYTRKVAIDVRDLAGYSASGFRYFRVGMVSNGVAVGLKVLLCAQVRQLTRDFQWGVGDDDQQTGVVMKTSASVRWGYDLGSAPRLLKATALLSDADAERVREWHRACAGAVGLTVLVPEPTNLLDVWPGYFAQSGASGEQGGVVISRVSHQRAYADVNALAQLTIEELTAGDPEWN